MTEKKLDPSGWVCCKFSDDSQLLIDSSEDSEEDSEETTSEYISRLKRKLDEVKQMTNEQENQIGIIDSSTSDDS